MPHAVSLAPGGHVAEPVRIELYGEAMCPFTAGFFNETMVEFMQMPGMAELVTFDYTPFGNAYYLTKECGGTRAPVGCSGSTSCEYDLDARVCFNEACGLRGMKAELHGPSACYPEADAVPNCQHGPMECLANRVQGCAKNTTTDPTALFDMTNCMFTEYLSETSVRMTPANATHATVLATAKGCAEAAGAPWPDIHRCVQTTEDAIAVEQTMARATPVHGFVPWVLVGGKPFFSEDSDDNEDEPNAADLAQLVCEAGSFEALPVCSTQQLAKLRRRLVPIMRARRRYIDDLMDKRNGTAKKSHGTC